ncbi:hypothetical protein EB155_14575, partial [archaeon]|nr:hypothetical protein [archaeon]
RNHNGTQHLSGDIADLRVNQSQYLISDIEKLYNEAQLEDATRVGFIEKYLKINKILMKDTIYNFDSTQYKNDSIFAFNVVFPNSPNDLVAGKYIINSTGGFQVYTKTILGKPILQFRAGNGSLATHNVNNNFTYSAGGVSHYDLDVDQYCDGKSHYILIELRPLYGEMRVWIDGVMRIKSSSGGGSSFTNNVWATENIEFQNTSWNTMSGASILEPIRFYDTKVDEQKTRTYFNVKGGSARTPYTPEGHNLTNRNITISCWVRINDPYDQQIYGVIKIILLEVV